MSIAEMIITAQVRGATVHTTADSTGTLAVVQVLGLARMTTWPLPVRAAGAELAAALR